MTETELRKILENKETFFIWDPRYCDAFKTIEINPKELNEEIKISVSDNAVHFTKMHIDNEKAHIDYLYQRKYDRDLEYVFKSKEDFYKFIDFDKVDIEDASGMHFVVDLNKFTFTGNLSDASYILGETKEPKNVHIYERWVEKLELVDEEKQIYKLSFVKK